MALLQFLCPRCRNPVALDHSGRCSTVFKGGTQCEFSLPIRYEDGNSKFRDKLEKHTTPPDSGDTGTFTGQYSWVDHSGTYPFCQQNVLDQGSLHLDQNSNYLFLWSTPGGSGPLANVYYGSAGTVGPASGVVMPLNSKPQNLHHFYDNYQPQFKHVADGPGLAIQTPDATHTTFRVLKSGTLIYEYDPNTKTEHRY
jgi:hypothetical protein